MNYSMKLITPPTVEPITVAEAKIYAHIDHDVDDSIILSWIKIARIEAENYQRRSYYEQVWELSFDDFPDLAPLLIPRPPLTSIDFIHYYDSDNAMTNMDLTLFIVDTNHEPGRLAHAYNEIWPSETLRPIDAVRIRYTCGYQEMYGTTTTFAPANTPIPEYVKDAIYLYCGYRNENRSGEIEEIPRQFYDLLNQDGFYTPSC